MVKLTELHDIPNSSEAVSSRYNELSDWPNHGNQLSSWFAIMAYQPARNIVCSPPGGRIQRAVFLASRSSRPNPKRRARKSTNKPSAHGFHPSIGIGPRHLHSNHWHRLPSVCPPSHIDQTTSVSTLSMPSSPPYKAAIVPRNVNAARTKGDIFSHCRPWAAAITSLECQTSLYCTPGSCGIRETEMVGVRLLWER